MGGQPGNCIGADRHQPSVQSDYRQVQRQSQDEQPATRLATVRQDKNQQEQLGTNQAEGDQVNWDLAAGRRKLKSQPLRQISEGYEPDQIELWSLQAVSVEPGPDEPGQQACGDSPEQDQGLAGEAADVRGSARTED